MVIRRNSWFQTWTRNAKHGATGASEQYWFRSNKWELPKSVSRLRYAFEGGQVHLFLTEKPREHPLSGADRQGEMLERLPVAICFRGRSDAAFLNGKAARTSSVESRRTGETLAESGSSFYN
jgi:hypothetical protein